MVRLELEKLRVYRQMTVDMPIFTRSLSVETFVHPNMKDMVIRMSGFVMAEEIDNRTKIVEFSVSVPSSWWQHFKQDNFPSWLVRMFPVKFKEIRKTKKVQFRRLATYPKASLVIPDEIGNVVIYRNLFSESED